MCFHLGICSAATRDRTPASCRTLKVGVDNLQIGPSRLSESSFPMQERFLSPL